MALAELFDESKKNILIIVLLIGIIVILSMIIVLRHKLVRFVKNYFTKDFVVVAIKSILLYGVVLLAGGSIMVLLYIYLGGDINIDIVMHIISSYIIAWVLGFIVPGAPGGIGVREFVLTLLLAPTLGQEITLTVSIIHRLTNIVGDFMAYVIAIVVFKYKNKRCVQEE